MTDRSNVEIILTCMCRDSLVFNIRRLVTVVTLVRIANSALNFWFLSPLGSSSMPLRSFYKIGAIRINGSSPSLRGHFELQIYNNLMQTKLCFGGQHYYYSFISSAYWASCDNMILFLSAGCHEFALSKVILHVHIQNGWTWKPFTIFCASNIAMKRQKSTEHNNSELENSSSTQKNVSLLPLIWSWSWSLHFFSC